MPLFVFVSGLLCKLIIITLPAILFASHYYFISEQNIKIWLTRQWKYILITGVLLVLPILIYIKVSGSLLLRASVVDMTVLDYFRTQIGVLPFEYIRKMLFPFNLTIEPNFPLVSHLDILYCNKWSINFRDTFNYMDKIFLR